MKSFRQVSLACMIVMAAALSTSHLGAVTPFETDVSTAIDRGIEWLANQGVFNNPSTASDASGLPMLALLEKRASGNPLDPPQGYTGASPTDQGRLRTAASYILDASNETGFYSYRDGNWMFALAEYARTGGPDKSVLAPANADYETIKQVMDRLTDRIIANQQTAANGFPLNSRGYWCYTSTGCNDSSTTQFAVAGLAAAKAFYTSGGSGDGGAWADPGRVTAIDAALTLARQAYELNAVDFSDNGSCSTASVTERGHGYRTGYAASLQQTASGVYIQLFGGSNVNTPSAQNYVEWLRNHYRFTDLDSLGNSWSAYTWSYYMWSSFKAMELIRHSGIIPSGSNLGPNDLGTLPSGSAPTCNVREVHKVTAAVSRPASFGPGGVGHYSAESQSQYFDYAHQIIGLQCYDGTAPINGNDGYFNCNGAPASWGVFDGLPGNAAHQSYLLLVLQRATGGACVDSDGDGVCDADDNCPAVSNPKQEDSNRNGTGDACEAGQVKLNVGTSPGTGLAGVTNIMVTGGSWPNQVIPNNDTTITMSKAGCFGANPVVAQSYRVQTVLGTTKRAYFTIPAGIAGGAYYVWISGPAGGGYSSYNCSVLNVVAAPVK